MIKETVFVAINKNDEIQCVKGSSSKTRWFRTDKYLTEAVEYHNRHYPDDKWEVRKCMIVEDCDDEARFPFIEGELAEMFVDDKWIKGRIVKGYRFCDGVVTIETDDGKRYWCGQDRTELYRPCRGQIVNSKSKTNYTTPECVTSNC